MDLLFCQNKKKKAKNSVRLTCQLTSQLCFSFTSNQHQSPASSIFISQQSTSATNHNQPNSEKYTHMHVYCLVLTWGRHPSRTRPPWSWPSSWGQLNHHTKKDWWVVDGWHHHWFIVLAKWHLYFEHLTLTAPARCNAPLCPCRPHDSSTTVTRWVYAELES